MNSTARMEDWKILTSKNQVRPKKENIVKGLSSIYMESKKRMTSKRPDMNLLDSDVADINVPIMNLSRKKTFNMEKWVNKTISKISDKIKQKSNKNSKFGF